jgi:hypothetical protein
LVETKARWYPELVRGCKTRLERILPEIKGADLRRGMREAAPRRNRRHAIGFLDDLLNLLNYHDARIFGRVWIKEPGGPCDDRSVYTFSVQDICADFQNLLETVGDTGIVIADSRNPAPNASVAHSVFTQKFKSDGDRYPNIQEMPVLATARTTPASRSRTFSAPRSCSPWPVAATAILTFRMSTWISASPVSGSVRPAPPADATSLQRRPRTTQGRYHRV